jgi:hypothetical protein
MKNLVAVGLIVIVAACDRERPPDRSSTVETTSAARTSSIAIRSTGAYEDSLLNSVFPGDSILTPAGDTLVALGGGSISNDNDYFVGRYRKNSTEYVKIERFMGYRPDGKHAIMLTILRLPLPAMDSTQWLLYGGMCGVNDSSDLNVLAIAVNNGDSVVRNISHAWRFDRAKMTLSEIPTANVVCWNDGDED